MRLLLVEDSVALVDELMPRLKQSGYAVDWIADGRDASRKASDEDYDIVVLDLGLPGRNGLDILRDWRAAGIPLPVLVLTARDTFAERIEGLRAGADDYLTKPFHPQLVVGNFTLDEQRQSVRRHGIDTELGGVEFRLLRYFMLNPRCVLSRSQLEQHLYDGETERDSNVLEVHINRLRRKLGRDVIETRRGQGYCFRG